LRKWENIKLEDLIAQINSTVNKVVGESENESDYAEEVRIQDNYKRRFWEERREWFTNPYVHTLPLRRTKRPKLQEQQGS